MKLNRLYFCLGICFFLTITQTASSQFFDTPSDKGFYVGAKGGLNVSSYWAQVDGRTIKPGNRTGFNGGLVAGYEFNKVFALHLEFLYSQQGASLGDEEFSALHLDYFDIPLLLRFTIDNSATILPRFFFGPVIGVETSCTLISRQTEGSQQENQSCDRTSTETSSLDVGLLGGLGVGFVVGKVLLVIDTAFEGGFTNVLETGNIGDSYKNYRFALNFGVEIPLGR